MCRRCDLGNYTSAPSGVLGLVTFVIPAQVSPLPVSTRALGIGRWISRRNLGAVTLFLGVSYAALVALLPAACALWWGRELARSADDPALPERLIANRKRNGYVLGFSLTMLGGTATVYLPWTLPLLVLTRMASSYPLRQVLYSETWGFVGYLSFFLRLIVAGYGFWLLLALTPVLTMLAGGNDWAVACILATVLLVWNSRYPEVFRYLMRARPVEDGAIEARFVRLVEACSLPPVLLAQVDLRGGVFANAVALPSFHRPAVVVTDTLLARLDADEVGAICAHELAHLEHFNPRRVRRLNLVTCTLIAAGTLLSPSVRLAFPSAVWPVACVWILVLVVVMFVRARDRQKNETASDLRAIALTGDPEALVRALTKLHAIAHVARRWATQLERQATHPSLARRIQAIRAAAGTPPASLGDMATFIGADGLSSATLHDAGILWNENEWTSHRIGYKDLSELRIDARPSGPPQLAAVDHSGRRWWLVLEQGDVARAQAVLDMVDGRVGRAPVPQTHAALTRVAALVAGLAGFALGPLAVVFLTGLAFVLPAPPHGWRRRGSADRSGARVARSFDFGGG